jgi:hypothetical protein
MIQGASPLRGWLQLSPAKSLKPFLRPSLSNRPKRPHLLPVVNVRIIGAEPLNSYVVRFPDKFCKTRQVWVVGYSESPTPFLSA